MIFGQAISRLRLSPSVADYRATSPEDGEGVVSGIVVIISPSQIRADDFGMGLHLGRRAGGDRAAVVQRHHAIGHR